MQALRYLPDLAPRALSTVLEDWRNRYPHMGVLALLPEAEREGVAGVQALCRDLAVPLVGAIFPALIEGGKFRTQGLWLLRFDVMPYAAIHQNLPREDEALEHWADELVAELKPHLGNSEGESEEVSLCLLFDAMVPNIGSLLDALYLQLSNRVRYMGANAGSETFQPMPCLFDQQRCVGDGVLAMLLQPHRGAILAHGYKVPERMITATSTLGNRILQIDWRPAFEVYRELARSQYGVDINRENFYQLAVHFPFGIIRANGITLVRIPVVLEEDGSLFCVGEVPANSVLALLEAPTVDSRHTLQSLQEGLLASNGSLAGREMLLYYCAGRRLHLGIAAAEAEIRDLTTDSGCGPLAGALSLGEIGSAVQREYPLFHNATLVASLWLDHVD